MLWVNGLKIRQHIREIIVPTPEPDVLELVAIFTMLTCAVFTFSRYLEKRSIPFNARTTSLSFTLLWSTNTHIKLFFYFIVYLC